MDSAVHFSSAFMAWRTPRGVFDALHDEFSFTVDGCSSDENALLPRHWTERDEPLLRSWAGERVFINPPYGRQIARWMEKAWTEAQHALIVALVPSRTDTAWWHEYVMPASEIRFIRGRLEFAGRRESEPGLAQRAIPELHRGMAPHAPEGRYPASAVPAVLPTPRPVRRPQRVSPRHVLHRLMEPNRDSAAPPRVEHESESHFGDCAGCEGTLERPFWDTICFACQEEREDEDDIDWYEDYDPATPADCPGGGMDDLCTWPDVEGCGLCTLGMNPDLARPEGAS